MASPQDGRKYPVAAEGSLQKEGSTPAPHTQPYPLNHEKVSLTISGCREGPWSGSPGWLATWREKEALVIVTGPILTVPTLC